MGLAKTESGRQRQIEAANANWLKCRIRGGNLNAAHGIASDLTGQFSLEERAAALRIIEGHTALIALLDKRMVGKKQRPLQR